jgi:hypothetical protein
LYDKLWPGLLPQTPVTAVSVPGNRFTFNAMLARYPERRQGATVLWAGTNSLYAGTGDPLQDALTGWVTP